MSLVTAVLSDPVIWCDALAPATTTDHRGSSAGDHLEKRPSVSPRRKGTESQQSFTAWLFGAPMVALAIT